MSNPRPDNPAEPDPAHGPAPVLIHICAFVSCVLWAGVAVLYPLTRTGIDPDQRTTWLVLVLAVMVTVVALALWVAARIAVVGAAVDTLRTLVAGGQSVVLHPTPVGHGADRGALRCAIATAAVPAQRPGPIGVSVYRSDLDVPGEGTETGFALGRKIGRREGREDALDHEPVMSRDLDT